MGVESRVVERGDNSNSSCDGERIGVEEATEKAGGRSNRPDRGGETGSSNPALYQNSR
jgi:hypothetical protein